MEANFWVLYGIGIILSFIILLLMNLHERNKGNSINSFFPFIGSLIFGLLIGFIGMGLASKILIIKDNHEYEYKRYFFSYVDNNNQKHDIKLGSEYLDNQSSHELIIYSVQYKKKNSYNSRHNSVFGEDERRLEYDSYAPKMYSKFKNYHYPDFIFTNPPASVTVKKTESAIKFFLVYKEDFNEDLLN